MHIVAVLWQMMHYRRYSLCLQHIGCWAPLENTCQCDNQEQQRKKKYLEKQIMAGMFQVVKLGKEQDVSILYMYM